MQLRGPGMRLYRYVSSGNLGECVKTVTARSFPAVPFQSDAMLLCYRHNSQAIQILGFVRGGHAAETMLREH